MKWIKNLHAVDSLALLSTRYCGNFVGYWTFFFDSQFVITPSAFGFRSQLLSSKFLLKQNLISYKYCSPFWSSSFKQLIMAFVFSWFLMARCISTTLNSFPGRMFSADRTLWMAYFSYQIKLCSKYLNGVLSSWIDVAHLPCLFHWYFQNDSSCDPKR